MIDYYNPSRHAIVLEDGGELAWEKNAGLGNDIYVHIQSTPRIYTDFMDDAHAGRIHTRTVLVHGAPTPELVVDCFRAGIQYSAMRDVKGTWTVWVMSHTETLADLIRMGSCRTVQPRVFLTVWPRPGAVTILAMHHNYIQL
jgi:hypothetical protein